MNPKIRTGLTHVGTAVGGGLAATMFLVTKSGDVLAIYDQLNVVVADVMKLFAIAMPIATAAYGVYKATTKSAVADVVAASGTEVRDRGRTILLHEPELREAAQEAKTDVQGMPVK